MTLDLLGIDRNSRLARDNILKKFSADKIKHCNASKSNRTTTDPPKKVIEETDKLVDSS
jgi:hypothetical protein